MLSLVGSIIASQGIGGDFSAMMEDFRSFLRGV
ncbi:hypothetical protein MCW_00014 [Cardidatus Bartonella washoeensis 085-0475]|uniref:Uncharacterized protein n=1 Tax=Cardidatus Bartonella washoeensis 085-0475 TaxID=1094564 RepID=J0QMB2_9HYPH|nr:hypothetical protein MCW_00014 [Bartonella washoeensis 085-0475]